MQGNKSTNSELANDRQSVRTTSPERELDCDNGHKLCYCAGRAECHNCGQPLNEGDE